MGETPPWAAAPCSAPCADAPPAFYIEGFLEMLRLTGRSGSGGRGWVLPVQPLGLREWGVGSRQRGNPTSAGWAPHSSVPLLSSATMTSARLAAQPGDWSPRPRRTGLGRGGWSNHLAFENGVWVAGRGESETRVSRAGSSQGLPPGCVDGISSLCPHVIPLCVSVS